MDEGIHELEVVARRGRHDRQRGRVWPILGLSTDPKMARVHGALEHGAQLEPARYEGSTRVYHVRPDSGALAWETDAGTFHAFEHGALVRLGHEELLGRLTTTPEACWAEVRSRVHDGDFGGARGVALNWTENLERDEDVDGKVHRACVRSLYDELVAYIGEAARHTIEQVPRLTGTTRQVAWAETIRGEMVDWIAHVRGELGAELDELADQITHGDRELVEARHARGWLALWGYEFHLRALEEVLHSETRARRYIEANPTGWRATSQWRSSRSPAALLIGPHKATVFSYHVRAWYKAHDTTTSRGDDS